MDVLVRIFHRWKSLPDQTEYEVNLLWVAAMLGFFGFLQAGEFKSVPGSDQVLLTLANVRVDHTNPMFWKSHCELVRQILLELVSRRILGVLSPEFAQ